jgi:hypothetical protein
MTTNRQRERTHTHTHGYERRAKVLLLYDSQTGRRPLPTFSTFLYCTVPYLFV